MILWINLPHAAFGLVVQNGTITEAPPIAKWTVGKRASYVEGYYKRKGAEVAHAARE